MKKQMQQKLLDTNYQKIRSCLMLAIFKWYGKLLLIPNVVTNTAYVCCMLLLLLSHVSHVQLCVTPYMAAHQAPVPGILQARVLEWAAISFSNA